ncbi:MAG TPA: SRPBCC domain-containing protein, partial [Chthoniobacteraceae bacterium]|nr:SRPBCC domain-containing protein [Chthoniobacteraceae bacterium]
FTWAWSDNPRDGGDETTVTVDLVEVQGGTQLTLTHEGFATVESRDAHNDGWTGTLVKLESLAEKECHSMTPGNFSWNELITTDTAKAGEFYTQLFGWKTEPMPGMPYTIFNNGNTPTGGMMQAQRGRSMWVAYVTVENTDATLAKALKLGAKACIEPKDIPGVGRIAVFEDPTGAIIGIWQQQKM